MTDPRAIRASPGPAPLYAFGLLFAFTWSGFLFDKVPEFWAATWAWGTAGFFGWCLYLIRNDNRRD